MKYLGDLYNVLNTKLLAFYNTYRKVYLLKEQYYNVYSIMLLGHTLDFYYNYLLN